LSFSRERLVGVALKENRSQISTMRNAEFSKVLESTKKWRTLAFHT
jgi:hypothetical protein